LLADYSVILYDPWLLCSSLVFLFFDGLLDCLSIEFRSSYLLADDKDFYIILSEEYGFCSSDAEYDLLLSPFSEKGLCTG